MSRSIVVLACAGILLAAPIAAAHVEAGARLFPVTLTFDDPGVGDELTLPQVTWQRSAGPQSQWQLQWEFDKTITPTTALIYNHGFDLLSQSGSPRRSGLENVFLTGKWQAYTNPEHEFVVSLGVAREFGGNRATQNIGGDTFGGTTPLLYFGKGLGDLPIGNFRPIAVTGEFGYSFADRRLNSLASNSGSPNMLSGSLSLQYSVPYLQAQVKDYALPGFLGNLVPLIEANWHSPASGPASGNPTQLMFGVGAIYEGPAYQVGVEALLPGNKASGQNIGFTVQVHVFFDDLLPHSLGKPLLNW